MSAIPLTSLVPRPTSRRRAEMLSPGGETPNRILVDRLLEWRDPRSDANVFVFTTTYDNSNNNNNNNNSNNNNNNL